MSKEEHSNIVHSNALSPTGKATVKKKGLVE